MVGAAYLLDRACALVVFARSLQRASLMLHVVAESLRVEILGAYQKMWNGVNNKPTQSVIIEDCCTAANRHVS